MSYINPRWVLVDYLRNNLTDPRVSRRPVFKDNVIISVAGQTEFSLSFSSGKSLSHISKVEVNNVEKKKWAFYYIDFRKNKIVFFAGLNKDDEVNIEFYENNKNWIFWDTLEGNLKPDQFPRLVITIVSGVGVRLGNYQAPVESTINVQFDVFCKEKSKDQIFEIDDKNYVGEELAERIAYDIQRVFEENENELHPIMYDYVPTSFPPRNIPFDEELQCHRKIVECVLSGIKMGDI